MPVALYFFFFWLVCFHLTNSILAILAPSPRLSGRLMILVKPDFLFCVNGFNFNNFSTVFLSFPNLEFRRRRAEMSSFSTSFISLSTSDLIAKAFVFVVTIFPFATKALIKDLNSAFRESVSLLNFLPRTFLYTELNSFFFQSDFNDLERFFSQISYFH